MINETVAFETAWSELAPMLTALTPAHLDITRRVGHILFGDGLRHGMDAGAAIALDALREKAADVATQKQVTIVAGGLEYYCILHANDAIEVMASSGDLLATARWNARTSEHEDAQFASCDHVSDYDQLNLILAHASEAWRKHGR